MNIPKGYYLVPDGEYVMSNFLYRDVFDKWVPTRNRDKQCKVYGSKYVAPLTKTPKGNKRV